MSGSQNRVLVRGSKKLSLKDLLGLEILDLKMQGSKIE